MKKYIIPIILLFAILSGCDKDEADIPGKAFECKYNFSNLTSRSIVFINGIDEDQKVTFDLFLTEKKSKDVTITITEIDESTAKATTDYQLSASQFVFPANSLKASGSIDFYYDGPELNESKTLLLVLSSTEVINGNNDTIEISIVKGNPLEIVFPGTYVGRYWDSPGDVGNYDAGWGHDGITLTFDDTDPEGKTMIMNNLWWGGLDVYLTFDVPNGTVHLAAGQILDDAYDNSPFLPNWTCGETTGTFDLSTKEIILNDFEVWAMNGGVSTLYSVETVGILWDDSNN